MGSILSRQSPPPRPPDNSNDTARNIRVLQATSTYYGPQFVFNSAPSNSSTARAYFDEVISILASNGPLSMNAINQPQLPPAELRTTKTLDAKVNLRKNTVAIRIDDHGLMSIEFNHDSTVPNLVKIYLQARKQSTQISATASFIVKPIVFGPFPAALNQTFKEKLNVSHIEQSELFENENNALSAKSSNPIIEISSATVSPRTILPLFTVSAPIVASPVLSTKTELEMDITTTTLFSLIIAIEDASENIPQHSSNTQTTCINLSINEASVITAKIASQTMIIEGSTYILQEIYGLEGSAAECNSDVRDCIICMSETKDTLVLPCRHLCLCGACAELLRMQGRDASSRIQGPPKCPICRQVFHSLLQISLPINYAKRKSITNLNQSNNQHIKTTAVVGVLGSDGHRASYGTVRPIL